MTLQLMEHWSRMSKEEISEEMLIIFIVTVGLCIIAGTMQYFKNKYQDKIDKSNSKVLKFIFNRIL